MALFAPDASEALLALFEQLSALAVHDLSLDFPVEASALVVDLGDEPRRRLRAIESSEALLPVLVIAAKEHAPLLATAVGVTDFLILPASAEELYLRVRRLTHAAGNDEVHHFKDLELNLLTYQATLGSQAGRAPRVLDHDRPLGRLPLRIDHHHPHLRFAWWYSNHNRLKKRGASRR
ncbi:MAG: hypothetical protein LC739_03575 [Actinobacteria bacterium]|nr:hypothetical protein [Actinomycetota bacterium]